MKPLLTLTLIAFVASVAGRAIHGPSQATTVTSLLPALLLRDGLQTNNTDATVNVAADYDPTDGPWLIGPDSKEKGQGRTPEQQEALWCKAKSRGIKLIKAMMMDEQEVATTLSWPYVQSPWDGDLKSELRKWGYLDDHGKHKENDNQCEFDKTHEMANAFKDLNVDPRSAGTGGPNHCFYVELEDGPTVIRDEDGELPFEEDQYYMADDKKYQVSGGWSSICPLANQPTEF
jgi:hypothetical protein